MHDLLKSATATCADQRPHAMHHLHAILTVASLTAASFSSEAQTLQVPNSGLAASNLSLQAQALQPLQRPGAFGIAFNANASRYEAKNAYLLAYLSTTIYPEYLALLNGKRMAGNYLPRLNRNTNGFFATEFERLLGPDFVGSDGVPAKFTFITSPANDPDGYDAEAMVVSNKDTVFIALRGTDRQARYQKDSVEYEVGEWVKTDFNIQPVDPGLGRNPRIQVHGGIWSSLRTVRADIEAQAKAGVAAGKKVWVTGHSLGAGQAQLLGAWLRDQGVPVQGVYVYAAPHVGNQEWVNFADRQLPNGRLLRFDFATDPVTMLGPWALGYRRAGQRMHYEDITGLNRNASEPNALEEAAIAVEAGINVVGGAVTGAVGEAIKASPVKVELQGNSHFCYHHQGWYLHSTWRSLGRDGQAGLPKPFDLPDAKDAQCNELVVARGRDKDHGRELEAAAGEALEALSFNVRELLENVTGKAIPEGKYTIRANKGGKFLDVSGSCMGEDGCPVQLWDLGKSEKNNVFRIQKEGPSYRITVASTGKSLEVHGNERFNDGARIQTWTSNGVPALNANQKWFVYSLRQQGDRYYCLLVNAASMKVLDAVNKDVNKNGGRVQIYKPVANDATQVWVLERDK
jgi:Lipase (class 3)/Ricin-type beta-trefoil lectin domain-like